jgi:very-short-patch-repair endonuclease
MTKFNTQKRARSLRKNQTPAEQLLWSKLRSHGVSGFKFRRQHPVDVYILDFYCHEVCLAVEIDGGHHAEEENRRMDHRRTAFLNKKGIRVIRFWNNDVLDNLDDVITEIDATLQEINANKHVDD